MKGRNTITMNSAEMQQAVQEYLNSKVFQVQHRCEVVSIEREVEQNCPVFVVGVRELGWSSDE